MKEHTLKLKAKDYFREKGYLSWMPPRVKWLKEQDIFGIWDGIAWRRNKFIFFQLTTISNKSARLKKIINFMMPSRLYITSPVKGWLMCYRKKTNQFEISEI